MSTADLIVVGGGPAGASAAIEADHLGLSTTLVEENSEAGGQVYKPLPPGFREAAPGRMGPDYAAGESLRSRLAASGVRRLFNHMVWHVERGFKVHAVGPRGPLSLQAPALLVATGTYERIVPFPGWTLPGVIGLGAATTLLKGQQLLPGHRVVVAGCGPLIPLVAALVIKAGGTVPAVVDLSSPGDFLRLLPRLATHPALLLRGVSWTARIRLSGTRWLFRHAVSEVRGEDSVREVGVVPVDAAWRPSPQGPRLRFEADALAVGHGLTPATELTRLLGAAHDFRPANGGWVAVQNSDGRTSLAGLYVAGDGAGVAGAAAASLRGQLAALAVARDLERLTAADYDAWARGVRRALDRAESFGHAMAGLMRLRRGLLETIGSDTVVCRCEDVTRGEIEDALDRGAGDMNQLKAWTRCGMGPCQGRMCGETAACLVAARCGGRETAGAWTPRPPVRPVPIEALVESFSYADIPLPPPAPL